MLVVHQGISSVFTHLIDLKVLGILNKTGHQLSFACSLEEKVKAKEISVR